jgi:hypothetical protein
MGGGAAEDAVWMTFMDNLLFDGAGNQHRAMMDRAMERMERVVTDAVVPPPLRRADQGQSSSA